MRQMMFIISCMVYIVLPSVSANYANCTKNANNGSQQCGCPIDESKLIVPSSTYPLAERDETKIDNYHGREVPNPYHWLEDPYSERTKKYVNELNSVSQAYISKSPIREKIRDTFRNFADYPRYSLPEKHGNYYYYFHNTGLQNQGVYYRQNKLDGEPAIFLDPNSLSHEGTTSIVSMTFSEDGSMLAYALSENGSDWMTVKFRRTIDGLDLPDKLERLRHSSLAWTHDNKGVFYNRYPIAISEGQGRSATKNEYQQLYFHYLGTNQSSDILCADFPNNPNYYILAQITDDGRFLLVTIHTGYNTNNLLYYFDLSAINNQVKGKLNLIPIIDRFDAKYKYISNDGYYFTFLTDYNASMYHVVQIDVRKPQKDNWRMLINEKEHRLEWASRVNENYLILCYIEDVKNALYVHDFASGNRLFTIPLDIGQIKEFNGQRKHSEIFYTFTSFLTPGIMYHLNLSSTINQITPRVLREIKINGMNSSEFTVKQVFYESRDKTKVPMFIFHKKALILDGTNPTLMYGYGGFGISFLPSFRNREIFFARFFNGIVAIPNLRGGGEYGKQWHESGKKEKKQNVFDDFIAAGEYLISNNYTCRDKLIIEGSSNGGLLVAACANQRPDLFGCVINRVGLMDMLRFQRFTIGHAWTPEYGSSDVKEEFEMLIKYSPLHNIRAPKNGEHYPAMLLMTADNDDRVVPSHSLKYVAQVYYSLRHIDTPRKPILIQIEVQAGHGWGKPISKIINESVDMYSFIYNVLDLKWSA